MYKIYVTIVFCGFAILATWDEIFPTHALGSRTTFAFAQTVGSIGLLAMCISRGVDEHNVLDRAVFIFTVLTSIYSAYTFFMLMVSGV